MEFIEKPIFSPAIITINECFFNASARKIADRTAELFRLYRIYKEISKTDESFDDFVFWGEMLLSDFNEVDKFHIDASNLFRNVTALKEIDYSKEYFTKEQQEAVVQFWNHFLPSVESKTKEEFIAIWKVMLPLYEQFRTELLSENTATEGMIFREITELLENNQLPDYFLGKNFVFIGFNALNKSEKILFSELMKRDQADFYWDYESEMLRDPANQASTFFKENSSNFPSKLKIEPTTEQLKEINFHLISVPSAVGQTKEVHNLLNELYPENAENKDWIKTAVVLPEESLLVPLLHSIPERIENVNVTMGYPLKASPVSGLLESIFDLQRRVNSKGHFYHLLVSSILNHQYISTLCRADVRKIQQEMIKSNAIYVDIAHFRENHILKTIFTHKKSPAEFVQYLLDVLKMLNMAWQDYSKETGKYHMECDFLYQYYIAINRMNEVMKTIGEFEMSPDTLIRLIRQLIGGVSIPFEGEPLNGLQVMGVLETRGLDFENLIICSFNEGVYPQKSTSNSFIPNDLRRAFEIPTFEYRDAISAYNFYRLIQRTKNIYFLYDNRVEGMQTGEVSRYFRQLHYHYGVSFNEINVTYEVNSFAKNEIKVDKNEEILSKLREFTIDGERKRALSASSINMYIDCPLRFYFSKVEGIKEQEEVQENVDFGPFGTLFHKSMELIYKQFVGKAVSKSDLDEVRKDSKQINEAIISAFASEFFKKSPEEGFEIELDGRKQLIYNVIEKYINRILEIDAARAPFRYIQSEAKINVRFPLKNFVNEVNIGGSIDRVDEKEGKIRVLDYKTGGDKLIFSSLDKVFETNYKDRPKVVLQTFLYSLLYEMETGRENIVPEVLKVKDIFNAALETKLIFNESKGKHLLVESFSDWKDEFVDKLTGTIEEIFNPDVPFVQCKEEELCKYCEFKTICKREVKESYF